jgi:hypothetical protein
VAGILFIVFVACTITCFLIFDAVLRVQHSRYRDLWEKDGKPHGFFFHPSGSSWVAMQVRFLVINFSTPDWLRSEERLLRWMRVFRFAQIIGHAAWLGGIYFGMVVTRK